jgi:putative oxidoreductase
VTTLIRVYGGHSFRVYGCRGGCTTVGGMMQRLFSTFPNSAPGAGLLLLRFCAGGELILTGLQHLSSHAAWVAHGLDMAQPLAGSLLILGLWTPASSACAALLSMGLALSDNRWQLHIAHAAIALSLIALGPGAWSIDARLYGRKRIHI